MIKRSPPFAPRQRPPGAARRARGFTLLEVLMVVTLLAIILGLIVGGAFAAMRWSRAQQTTAALSALDAVAETYRRETQEWLPAFPAPSWNNPPLQLSYFISRTYGDATNGDEAIGDIEKQLHGLAAAFIPPTTAVPPNGRVMDPYGNIINCYNPNKGAWNAANSYLTGDVVIDTASNQRYRALQNALGAGQSPSNNAFWMADASAGRPWFWSNGPNGINDSGLNGRQGPNGSVGGDDVASTGSKP